MAFLLLGLAGGSRSAQAETINCQVITAVPFTIPASGIYCLTGDLNTNLASGAAITIAANNVVLDLNGHKLGNLAAGPGTQATGIRAQDRKGLTIKNGTVRGFLRGIELADFGVSQGHVVEDIRADKNTSIGIDVRGLGNLIRNNQVVATGGCTMPACDPDVAGAFGIVVNGTGPRVLNNDVIDTEAQGAGTAFGIRFGFVSGGLAVSNRVTNADIGISYDLTESTGKFRDNQTGGVDTPFSFPAGDVIDAGGNN